MPTVETIELTIMDKAIHCSGWEKRIQSVLGRLPGVRNVKADHKTQKVQVALEKERTSAGQVIEKLEFLGYSVLSRKDQGE